MGSLIASYFFHTDSKSKMCHEALVQLQLASSRCLARSIIALVFMRINRLGVYCDDGDKGVLSPVSFSKRRPRLTLLHVDLCMLTLAMSPTVVC